MKIDYICLMNGCDQLKMTTRYSPPSSTPSGNDPFTDPELASDLLSQWDHSKHKAGRGLASASTLWLALLVFSRTLQPWACERAQASLLDDETCGQVILLLSPQMTLSQLPDK